jgi:hypothetical protein
MFCLDKVKHSRVPKVEFSGMFLNFALYRLTPNVLVEKNFFRASFLK